jgi:hypothetical protein
MDLDSHSPPREEAIKSLHRSGSSSSEVSDFVTIPSCEKLDMALEAKVDLGKTKMGTKSVIFGRKYVSPKSDLILSVDFQVGL